MTYSAGIMFIKLSFLLLYRRIFKSASTPSWRCLWWITLFVVVGYSIGGILASLLACLPIYSGWDLTITPSVCINKAAFYIANACLNVATDLVVLALPIPIIWRTLLSLRQKILLH